MKEMGKNPCSEQRKCNSIIIKDNQGLLVISDIQKKGKKNGYC